MNYSSVWTVRINLPVLFVVFGLACVFFANTLRGDSEPAGQTSDWLPIGGAVSLPEDELLALPMDSPNWRLLAFSNDRKVVSVLVIIYKYKTGMFGGDRLDPHLFDKQYSDSKTLALVQLGLSRSLREAQEPIGVGAIGQLPVGQIQIKTNHEVFKIAFGVQGFGMCREYIADDNEFYSWILAKILQDIATKEKLDSISQRVFSGMSGDRWLRSGEQEYQDLKDK